jgi:hypothetical protein
LSAENGFSKEKLPNTNTPNPKNNFVVNII